LAAKAEREAKARAQPGQWFIKGACGKGTISSAARAKHELVFSDELWPADSVNPETRVEEFTCSECKQPVQREPIDPATGERPDSAGRFHCALCEFDICRECGLAGNKAWDAKWRVEQKGQPVAPKPAAGPPQPPPLPFWKRAAAPAAAGAEERKADGAGGGAACGWAADNKAPCDGKQYPFFDGPSPVDEEMPTFLADARQQLSGAETARGALEGSGTLLRGAHQAELFDADTLAMFQLAEILMLELVRAQLAAPLPPTEAEARRQLGGKVFEAMEFTKGDAARVLEMLSAHVRGTDGGRFADASGARVVHSVVLGCPFSRKLGVLCLGFRGGK
jgi:hypothetical protein